MISVCEVMTRPFQHNKILGIVDPTKDDDGNDFLMLFMPYSTAAFATILVEEDTVKVKACSHKTYFAGGVGPPVRVEVTYKPKRKKWHPEGKYPTPFGIYYPMTKERQKIRVHHPRRHGLMTGDVDLPIEQQAFRAAYITFKYYEKSHCLPSHYWVERKKEFPPEDWNIAREEDFTLRGIGIKNGKYILFDSGVMWTTNNLSASEGVYINRYFDWG